MYFGQCANSWLIVRWYACFQCIFGQIQVFLLYFKTFFVFLYNFVSPKWPYDDGNMVRSSKSQNHRKYPKIIENHVFWTMCELLAYCKVVGVFLVHFWTNIGRFTVFQNVFCVFMQLFESQNVILRPKNMQNGFTERHAGCQKFQKNRPNFFFPKMSKMCSNVFICF